MALDLPKVNISNNRQRGTMNMNLAKSVSTGERVNLAKEQGSLSQYAVGLNWNEKAGITADCDVSVVLLKEDGTIIQGKGGANQPNCLCYYGNQKLKGVMSYGDNLTGNDSEIQTPSNSDEQIDIDLNNLPIEVAQVLIVATTHSELNGQPSTPLPFGRVAKPVLTVFNNSNSRSPIPLYNFELDEEFCMATAVEIAKFYKRNGQWMYVSMADEVGKHAFGLQSILDKFKI